MVSVRCVQQRTIELLDRFEYVRLDSTYRRITGLGDQLPQRLVFDSIPFYGRGINEFTTREGQSYKAGVVHRRFSWQNWRVGRWRFTWRRRCRYSGSIARI